MVNSAISHAKQKKLDNATETGISILVQSLLEMVKADAFYSLKEMKTKMLSHYDEEQKWIKNRWIGGALKRLGLTEKRRVGNGTEYKLTVGVVKDLADRMEVELTESPEGKKPISETELGKLKELRVWMIENRNEDNHISNVQLCSKITTFGFSNPTNVITDLLEKEGLLAKDVKGLPVGFWAVTK